MKKFIRTEDMMRIPARELSDHSKLAQCPLISVVMATYNHEKYIGDAINGVLKQTRDFPLELLIGEDCSTDGTRDICASYQRRNPQMVRLITSERNLGMHMNALRLFGRAKGRYVAICEGDDYWTAPDKLQRQISYVEKHQECSLCFHNARVIYDGNRTPPHDFVNSRLYDITLADIVQKEWFIPTCSTLFVSAVLKQLPIAYEQFPCGDIPMWILLSRHGKTHYIDKVMSVYRKTFVGMSNKNLDPRTCISFYRKYIEMLGVLDGCLDHQHGSLFTEKQDYMRGLVAYASIKHGLELTLRDYIRGSVFFVRYTLPRRFKRMSGKCVFRKKRALATERAR